jgi:cold shock CspA family protein
MEATPVVYQTPPTSFVVGDIQCRVGAIGDSVYMMEFLKVVKRSSTGTQTRHCALHRGQTKAASIETACLVATALAQRLDAAIADMDSFRITGRVKWFNDSKGFGFITPDSEADDVFIHHSELLMPGFRTVQEGERVSFELRAGVLGSSASGIARTAHPEDFASLGKLGFDPENIALALVDGMLKVIAVAADGRWRFVDDLDRRHSLLYVWSLEASLYRTAVDELEVLINLPHVRESELHDFFERHPEFILTNDYRAAHSKVVLESEGDTLIPDFVLEPVGSNPLCDLLELKLPDLRVDVSKPRRNRFSAAVAEACAQLRTYRDFFEETRNRERFQDKYRLQAFRPRLMVIIGRRGQVDPIELRRVEGDLPGFQIRTYDDILERAKHKLSHFKHEMK